MNCEYLEKLLYIRFDDVSRAMVEQYTSRVHFKKGFTVLRKGEQGLNLYAMLKGIIRGYYIDDQGNDITKCFCMENGVFATERLRTKEPFSYTIECLEDCECIKIPYDLVSRMMEENSEVRNTINNYFIQEIAKLESRIKDLVMKTAEERYNDFCNEFPGLHNRVPLKYIASYIGVRIPSLSRIRKNRSLSLKD